MELLRAIRARGWRVLLAPPLSLGGAGLALAGMPLEAEHGWQVLAVRGHEQVAVYGDSLADALEHAADTIGGRT